MEVVFNILGDFFNGLMDLAMQQTTCVVERGRHISGGQEAVSSADNIAMNPVQKTGCAFNPLRAPFEILFRRGCKQAEESDSVGPVGVDQIIGVDNISF